jgi:hypothetical protein
MTPFTPPSSPWPARWNEVASIFKSKNGSHDKDKGKAKDKASSLEATPSSGATEPVFVSSASISKAAATAKSLAAITTTENFAAVGAGARSAKSGTLPSPGRTSGRISRKSFPVSKGAFFPRQSDSAVGDPFLHTLTQNILRYQQQQEEQKQQLLEEALMPVSTDAKAPARSNEVSQAAGGSNTFPSAGTKRGAKSSYDRKESLNSTSDEVACTGRLNVVVQRVCR